MFDKTLKKLVSFFYRLDEVPRRIINYVGISILLYICWQAILILGFSPATVKIIQKSTYHFLEFSFFVVVGTATFFANRWHQDKKRIDSLMADDMFVKVEELTTMLIERDEKIKKKEERLSAIFRTAPIGIGLIDGERNFIEVNKYFEELLGYTNEELIGRSVGMIYPDIEEYVRVGKIKYELIMKEGMGRLETTMLAKNGDQKNILLSSTWLNRKDPKSGTVFTVMDMTELHETIDNFSLDEERLESLYNLSQLLFKDEAGMISHALEESVRLTRSTIGYFHFVSENEKENTDLNLFVWSKDTLENCTAKKVDHYPLSHAGIWADSVRQRKAVIHNDYMEVATEQGLPEGHIPLHRHMSVPIYDSDRKIVGIIGVGNKTDEYLEADARQLSLFVTSVWHMIETNRKSALFENIFDSVNNGIAIYEPTSDGQSFIFKRVNPASAAIGDLSIDGHTGKRLEDLYPSIGDLGLLDVFRRVHRTGHSEKHPLSLYKDNRLEIWVENYVFKAPSGEIVAVYNDLTDTKRAEDDLKQSEQKFRKAIEYNTDAVILVDNRGVVKYVNPAMEKLTGASYADLVDNEFGQPLTNGEITSIDIIGKDGSARCAEMRVSKVGHAVEDPMYVVSLRDFTEVPEPCIEEETCPIQDYSEDISDEGSSS